MILAWKVIFMIHSTSPHHFFYKKSWDFYSSIVAFRFVVFVSVENNIENNIVEQLHSKFTYWTYQVQNPIHSLR